MLQAMLAELALKRNYLQANPIIETLYFGGGTPSLLTADEIGKLIDEAGKHFDISNIKEVTLEANPDDLTHDYVKTVRHTPINRFSIGTQSFFDSDLKYMNRAHNAQEADYAIKAVQDAGFENITIDLIYGTPGLTDKNWLHNLGQVKQLGVPHFSAYALTVEEGTALHHNISKKKSTPVNPDQAAHQFEMLMDFAAEHGYEHYEISNLAQEGRRAVHNTNYWLGVPYIGIGPSAHSFDGQHREWNVANNALYMKNLLTNKKVESEKETLTPTQRLNEYIMTSLRTIWGLDLQKVSKEWDEDYAQSLIKNSEPFIEQDKLKHTENRLILTNRGKLFADYIAGELFFD